MLANEIRLYVDYREKLARQEGAGFEKLKTYRQNLEQGMEYCLEVANSAPYRDENLQSISPVVTEQRVRLAGIIEAKRLKTAVDA